MKITAKINWKKNIVGITAITILTLLSTANAAPACRGTPVAACGDTSLVPVDQPCANYYFSPGKPICDNRTANTSQYGRRVGERFVPDPEFSADPGCDNAHKGMQCSGANGNCTNGGGFCD